MDCRKLIQGWAARVGVALLVASGVSGAEARIGALVIGIDVYATDLLRLKGAVADARDLSAALSEFGAPDVVTLLDRDATHARIKAAWQRLVDASGPGDTLVFAFAGHGTRIADVPALDEADGMNEAMLLGGLDRAHPGERILDDEFAVWLRAATERGARVLVLIDSCHSGTMDRTADGRGTTRDAPAAILRSEFQLTGTDLGGGFGDAIDEQGIPGVTYVGAAQDNQVVPELPIGQAEDGSGLPVWRGALSHELAAYFRRAEVLRRVDLLDIARAVQQVSGNRQTPSIVSDLSPDAAILSRSPVPGAMPTQPEPIPELMTLAVEGGDDALRKRLGASLPDVIVVSGDAALVWDVGCRTLRGPELDLTGGAEESRLRGFVDKWLLVGWVKDRLLPRPVNILLDPPPATGGRYGFGAVFSMQLAELALPNLVVFAVAGDGTAALLYPQLEHDSLTIEPGRALSLEDTKAVEPAGVDHIVAMTSAAPPDALLSVLRGDSVPAEAAAIRRELEALAVKTRIQVGILPLVTGPAASCG